MSAAIHGVDLDSTGLFTWLMVCAVRLEHYCGHEALLLKFRVTPARLVG
jgi:hypothetical protein